MSGSPAPAQVSLGLVLHDTSYSMVRAPKKEPFVEETLVHLTAQEIAELRNAYQISFMYHYAVDVGWGRTRCDYGEYIRELPDDFRFTKMDDAPE